jgi:polyhydroxyalkanoate synthesis regulator phasin
MMTQANQPESIGNNSIESKLDTIIRDITMMKSQLDRVEQRLDGIDRRLDGIDNRLWVFMGGILFAALAALLRLIPEV